MIDISQALHTGHSMIAFAAEEVRKAQDEYDRAKHKTSIAEANAIINNQDAKNQAILKALVERDESVIAFKSSELKAKTELAAKNIKLEEARDIFVSARKLASLSDDERKSLSDSYTSKYGNRT